MPTRELALQTSAIVKEMSKHMGVTSMVTTGGTGVKDDILRLYSPIHIIVGEWLTYHVNLFNDKWFVVTEIDSTPCY